MWQNLELNCFGAIFGRNKYWGYSDIISFLSSEIGGCTPG